MLMVMLPWSAMTSSHLDGQSDDSRATPKTWGAEGSNDTGWISLAATGADPDSGTMAYADLFLDFAPGALLDNFTFEIAVDGGEGYWATSVVRTRSPPIPQRSKAVSSTHGCSRTRSATHPGCYRAASPSTTW
jgi:hypothetical protein